MSNHNLYAQIAARFPARPDDKVFARLPDGRSYSYGDVDRVSAQFANLVRSLGAKPGDRVAVQVEKSIEALMLYLGVVRAGCVFLPLNTGYPPAELAYFLGDAKPALFICSPEKRGALEPVAREAGARLETLGVYRAPKEGESVEAIAGTIAALGLEAGTSFVTHVNDGADLAAILYTSGTTGRSKGAMLSHDNLASNSITLADYWRFTPDDVLIHALPIFHTHGLFVATNVALFANASIILLQKFDAAEVLRWMPSATSMMGVPTFYTRLLDEDGLTKQAASNMRLFISGSAPLLAETHRAWTERTGHAILERYGMTETNMNTSNPYDGERRPGTVGFALPGVSLRIVDPDSGMPVAKGEIGMIEVKGPNVFSGYWQMPEKTASEFRPDGYFITGDLAREDGDGYVQIVGRGKDLIISGGFNVYPKEVEGHIDDMAGVNESAVIGVPHRDFGEGVVAIVVPEKGASPDPQAIGAALREKLAAFKCPKRIVIVDELPRNTMGKVQKNLLRDQYKDIFA
ncbi:MAG: malonyl-CoA synthase [Flavobacteriaceae bacterium]